VSLSVLCFQIVSGRPPVVTPTVPLNGATICGVENGGVMPKRKTNAAFLKMAQATLKPSPQLAEVLGSSAPISRPQVAKKVWAYIKKHKLQDPKKRREIVADEKLKPVFGKARLDMFQMTKAISKHLNK
jgi:upstream activation factor subunit UAF30